MANIQKRNGKYRARYRDNNGRERNRTFDRKKDAENWIATQQTSMLTGGYVDPKLGRKIFSDYVDEYLATVVWNDRTRELYEWVIKKYLLPRYGHLAINKIDRGMVKELVADNVYLSSSSVRNMVKCLRVILNSAVDDGLLAVNPCSRVKLPPETTREMQILSHDQVATLAEEIGEHYSPLIYTAAYVGFRWGELAGLPPRNINWLRKSITIDRQLIETRGQLKYGPPKTKKSVRTVSVPGGIMELLSTMDMTGELVFSTARGLPMRRSNFRYHFKKALAASGIPVSFTFHELRHTAASFGIEVGAHPKTICDRLGHSSITMTMDRYGHLFPSQDEALAKALDERLVVKKVG